MRRLTYDTGCRYVSGPNGTLGGHYCYSSNCSPKAIIERLGEYEDLGYTPGELKRILEHAYVPLLNKPKDVEE